MLHSVARWGGTTNAQLQKSSAKANASHRTDWKSNEAFALADAAGYFQKTPISLSAAAAENASTRLSNSFCGTRWINQRPENRPTRITGVSTALDFETFGFQNLRELCDSP